MPKVVIIGGGISGLVSGIYAQQNGFDTEIYEKNAFPGGECTGWERRGYQIDNCIHWLTGCRKEDSMNEIWKNIGAISDNTVFYKPAYMYRIEMDGVILSFWLDLARARKEFLEIAPEDTIEINKFFDNVKKAECIKIPTKKSQADMGIFDYIKFGMSMKDMQSVMKEYGHQSMRELANRFKNKYVHNMMQRYFGEHFLAYTMITTYAFYSSGIGQIPEGGSKQMAERITERYKQLGGRLYTGKTAIKINISKKRAKSVTFEDGTVAICDYLISAIDTNFLFSKLLDKSYMNKKMSYMYSNEDGYKISSLFNVSFGINGTDEYAINDVVLFPCEPFTIGRQAVDFIGIHMFDNDNTIFPKDKRVLQCNIEQDERDYEYWKNLYSDRHQYRAEKERIAKEIEERIVCHYPMLKDQLILLDTYSPMTFTRWCNAYKGSYMSFYEQSGYKRIAVKNTIQDLSNVFLAGQWLNTSGGLPIAATNGMFAVHKMLSVQKREMSDK